MPFTPWLLVKDASELRMTMALGQSFSRIPQAREAFVLQLFMGRDY